MLNLYKVLFIAILLIGCSASEVDSIPEIVQEAAQEESDENVSTEEVTTGEEMTEEETTEEEMTEEEMTEEEMTEEEMTEEEMTEEEMTEEEMTEEEMTEEEMTEEEMEATETLAGIFVSAAHPTEGTVSINAERTKLTITGFKSDSGPLLELYLATNLTADEYVTLGVLQGLEGDFVYDIPTGVNLETHKYLTVWCVTFSIDFGHAILE